MHPGARAARRPEPTRCDGWCWSWCLALVLRRCSADAVDPHIQSQVAGSRLTLSTVGCWPVSARATLDLVLVARSPAVVWLAADGIWGRCAFPGLFSPQPWSSPTHPALILISITSHHGNCRMLAHTRANLYTCWQLLAVVGEDSAVLALCQRWEGCTAMSSLVCCAAHLRGGLTPPAGHPLGASSWGRLLIFFIISMQVGGASLGLRSSARGQRRVHYRAALEICRVPRAAVVPICTRIQCCAAC